MSKSGVGDFRSAPLLRAMKNLPLLFCIGELNIMNVLSRRRLPARGPQPSAAREGGSIQVRCAPEWEILATRRSRQGKFRKRHALVQSPTLQLAAGAWVFRGRPLLPSLGYGDEQRNVTECDPVTRLARNCAIVAVVGSRTRRRLGKGG